MILVSGGRHLLLYLKARIVLASCVLAERPRRRSRQQCCLVHRVLFSSETTHPCTAIRCERVPLLGVPKIHSEPPGRISDCWIYRPFPALDVSGAGGARCGVSVVSRRPAPRTRDVPEFRAPVCILPVAVRLSGVAPLMRFLLEECRRSGREFTSRFLDLVVDFPASSRQRQLMTRFESGSGRALISSEGFARGPLLIYFMKCV